MVAHPSKIGKGRAPAFVVGLAKAKTRVGHPPDEWSTATSVEYGSSEADA